MTGAWRIALGGALTMAGCVPPTTAPPTGIAAPVVEPTPRHAATALTGNPSVGGATMPVDRTIAAGITAAPTLSMLLAAVKAAELTDTLGSAGPYTLFAPTDAAFGRLAPGTVDRLLEPQNRSVLTRVLSYHIVPGTITTADLLRLIQVGHGTAELTTLAHARLRVTMTGDIVTLTSETGNVSYVEVANVRQTNGVIHVVNGVLIPALD